MDKEQPSALLNSHSTPIEELSVTECFDRLKLVSQKGTYKEVAHWIERSAKDYSNWKRSEKIPYADVIRKLLQERVSLNWFFAPGYTLFEPTYAYNTTNYVKASTVEEERKRRMEFLKAHKKVEPLLKAQGLENNETCLAFMLDVYFTTTDKWMEKSQALELMARALAFQPAISTD